jgi:hypothetical protein
VRVVVEAGSRGVALYEKRGFRRSRREEFGTFFDTGREGYWQVVWGPGGVGRGERRVERVRGDD